MATAIDIFNVQPSVVSRDLKGKFIAIYGLPKVGKTSMAAQFPKNLLVGFEHGWNALPGIKAIDITRWADFKLVLRQLERPEAKEVYQTITIDTVGIAWEMCEQYVCQQNGVQKISEVPWGAGYSVCKKEFENCLRKITQLGFGLVIIAHVDRRIEKRADDSEVEILGPAIPRRAYDIVNQLVDIIGYIDVTWDKEGNSERYLYTRKTPTIMAGSRFPYLAPKINFGYKELVDAIAEAIEKQAQLDGANVVDTIQTTAREEINYKETRERARVLWEELVTKDVENANIILKKIEMVFGRKMKLSEVTEDQVDLLNLVILDMEDMLKEYN